MYREVQIGDKSVALLANGATPIRYKQIFSKDIIAEFADAEKEVNIEFVAPLTYVMAKQAAGEIATASRDDFYEWLESFEAMDITMAAKEILEVYTKNLKGSSVSKKKQPGRRGK